MSPICTVCKKYRKPIAVNFLRHKLHEFWVRTWVYAYFWINIYVKYQHCQIWGHVTPHEIYQHRANSKLLFRESLGLVESSIIISSNTKHELMAYTRWYEYLLTVQRLLWWTFCTSFYMRSGNENWPPKTAM